ncbi:hypothetical protein ALC57_00607 [Trachymyrmex cornetzi]|uniref:Endonuclease/exonuclease/phosphatase domain-containing protein n=1 Tax=Trachymyrmex cornetzi TaxID=471704 RepID=A0A151JRE6_9HYME|nr:hypothetical protein ALC57_00607 [Trachymyrmex cornetzi]
METKCPHNSGVYISGCRTYQIPSRGLSGGLAIAIRKDIDFNIISGFRGLDGGFDILGIRTINLSINFNVVSVYRRPGGFLRVNDFRPLFYFDPGGCESIFLGDFNAHNTLWNCEYTIGESLQEAMERRDFMCVNMDTCSRIGATNLDLLFCSAAVLDNIEYNQLDDKWDSDHFPIVFKLETHRGIYSKRTNRITTKKTDWNKYAELVRSKFEKFFAESSELITGSDGLSVRYSGFTKVLTDAAHEATGRRPNQLSGGKRIRREKSGNSNSWWDKDCDSAVNDRKMGLREFKRDKCLNKYIEYKRCRAVARKTIEYKKKMNFEAFCKSINRFSGMRYVWNKMRVLKNTRNSIEWNKWQTKNREEEIVQEIFKLSPDGVVSDLKLLSSGEEESPMCSLFCYEELERVLSMVK